MYLTFEEYQEWGGQQSESAYSRLEYKARMLIDEYTFGRLRNEETIPEAVKRLVFELVGMLGNMDISAEGYAGVVDSEGNDGYSIKMASGTVLTAAESMIQMGNLIETYLANEKTASGIPLLYCGRLG